MKQMEELPEKPESNPWDRGILWRLKFALAFQVWAVILGVPLYFIIMWIMGRNPVEEAFGEEPLFIEGLITLALLFIVSMLCAGGKNPAPSGGRPSEGS